MGFFLLISRPTFHWMMDVSKMPISSQPTHLLKECTFQAFFPPSLQPQWIKYLLIVMLRSRHTSIRSTLHQLDALFFLYWRCKGDYTTLGFRFSRVCPKKRRRWVNSCSLIQVDTLSAIRSSVCLKSILVVCRQGKDDARMSSTSYFMYMRIQLCYSLSSA